eukprot:3414971-Prymnesium_polylepis.1
MECTWCRRGTWCRASTVAWGTHLCWKGGDEHACGAHTCRVKPMKEASCKQVLSNKRCTIACADWRRIARPCRRPIRLGPSTAARP